MNIILYLILNLALSLGFIVSSIWAIENYISISATITKIESCQGRLCEVSGESLRNNFNQFLISVVLLLLFYNLRIWLRRKDRALSRLEYLRENKTRFTADLQHEHKDL